MSILSGVAVALTGAITTGIIGNYLVQRWQRRSWFAQQRQLFHEQELAELKRFYEQVTQTAEARLFAMRQLAAVLPDGNAEVERARDEYRKQLTVWNSSLRSFFPTVTLHYGWSMTLRLENEIHANFVDVGRSLERLVRGVLMGAMPSVADRTAVARALNGQAGKLSSFFEAIADGLENKRDEVLNGKRHTYRSGALNHFSTRDLIKALFTSDVDGFNVVRPA